MSDNFRTRSLYAHRAKHGNDRGQHVWATIHENWKLIEDSGVAELYDHDRDFYEQKNRIELAPERAQALQKRLESLRGRGTSQRGEQIEIEFDEDMLNRLRKLGYVADEEE